MKRARWTIAAAAILALGVTLVASLGQRRAGPAEEAAPEDPDAAPAVDRRSLNAGTWAEPIADGRVASPFDAKDAELDDLRRRMRLDPDDLEAKRAFLRATTRGISHAQWRERCDVILWFIENEPGDVALSRLRVQRTADAQLWHDADEAWREAIALPDASTEVLVNAAGWYDHNDPETAVGLYRRLQEREPDKPEWLLAEGRQHWLAGMDARGRPEEARAHAEASVAAYGEALEIATGAERLRALGSGVSSAVDAGDWDSAERWARELVSEADPSEHASSLRRAHWALGRGLMDDGDFDGAEAELLQMAALAGSADGFGRLDSLLARGLLREGRTEAVLEWLEMTQSHWPADQVERWRAEIEAGEVPRFR